LHDARRRRAFEKTRELLTDEDYERMRRSSQRLRERLSQRWPS